MVIARLKGLKILWSESSVRVRPPPPASKQNGLADKAAASGIESKRLLTSTIFPDCHDRIPVEALGAGDAIGSTFKGISKVTDCGILQI